MSHTSANPVVFKADMMLLLVTVLAAISWMFSKEALDGFPPLLFIGTRFLFAGLLLAIPGYSGLKKLTKHQWKASSGVGILFGIAMSTWIMGLFYATHLGEGSFITSLAVVLVPLISWLFFGDAMSRASWIALPLAFAGMGLLSLQHGFRPELSQLLFFTAALLLSRTFILNGRAAAHVPALALSAIQLSIVGIVAIALSAGVEEWPDTWTADMWWWLLLSVTVGTAARFFLQTYAQGMTTPSHAAVIMIVEPVWTATFAALWFGETMSLSQLFGCSLIFLSLVVNRWSAVRMWLARKS